METQIEIAPSEQIIENAKKSESVQNDGPMIPKGKQGPKKIGRPKKERPENTDAGPQKPEQEKPKFEIPSQVICYPLVKAISFAGVSVAKDQRAAISASEAEDMARAMGMVMDKWMPDAMAKWGPEVMLGLSLGQYGLRVYSIARAREEALKRTEAARTGPSEARPQEPQFTTKIVSESAESVIP